MGTLQVITTYATATKRCIAQPPHPNSLLRQCVQVRQLVSLCNEAVASGAVPWAAVALEGFQHLPCCWRGTKEQLQEGFNMNGSQVLVLLPGAHVCLFEVSQPQQRLLA